MDRNPLRLAVDNRVTQRKQLAVPPICAARSCGARLYAETRFCPFCGVTQLGVVVPATRANQAEAPGVPAEPGADPWPGTIAKVEDEQLATRKASLHVSVLNPVVQPPNASRGWRRILVAAVWVIALTGTVWAVYQYLVSSNERPVFRAPTGEATLRGSPPQPPVVTLAGGTYQGRIDGSIEVRMTVVRNGLSLRGQYVYTRFNNPIAISGEVRLPDIVEIRGLFDGRIIEIYYGRLIDGGTVIKGDMVRQKDMARFNFVLYRIN